MRGVCAGQYDGMRFGVVLGRWVLPSLCLRLDKYTQLYKNIHGCILIRARPA